MKAIYGPVASWRLKRSLGIDPLCSNEKICSFDCIYCQLGKGRKTYKRQEFISLERLKRDLKFFKENNYLKKEKADVLTFSGTGEPTLAKNLNDIISYLRNVSNLPLAILTNSSLLSKKDVQNSLCKLDIVIAKLDAPNETIFRAINRPCKGVTFKKYLQGIKNFREIYPGKFALQIMFVKENKEYTEEIVNVARRLKPDVVQVNTPLRPCQTNPLGREEIRDIKDAFSDFKNVISVYESKIPEVMPFDLNEIKKRKRPKP